LVSDPSPAGGAAGELSLPALRLFSFAIPCPRLQPANLLATLQAIARASRWVIACGIVVFWRLGYASLLDPDEAHYAELTREMVRAKSWLVPLLDGRPFIDKPVLFHWLQAASVALLGESEFAVRLPTALAAVGVFFLTRWLGATLFGARTGEWAALMFATIPATFALANVALFDMVFTLFLFGAVACLTVAACRPSSSLVVQIAGFVLLALAVMTKGPIALVLVALWAGVIWWLSPPTRVLLGRANWVLGVGLVLIVSAPWFVWMYLTFGRQFVDGYLLAGNVWYFTQPQRFSGREISYTYYVRVFLAAFFPWSLLIFGRAAQWAKDRGGDDRAAEEGFLWAWIAVIVAFFTIARFKLDHYIFPAAPAVAIVGARAWIAAAAARDKNTPITWSIAGIGATMVVASIVCAATMYRLGLELDWTAALLPIVLGVSGVALVGYLVAVRAAPSTPAAVVAALLAAYAIVVVVGFPVLERTRPVASIGRRIAARTSPTDLVAIYRLERWRASLRYYVKRPVTRLEEPSELRAFLAKDRRVVMLRRDFEALKAMGFPLEELYRRRGVIGTSGRVLRRQRWDFVLIATITSDSVQVPKPR
jgi:4-amino-4-deoxy-L-arabinose transferase-like glycosyltransferase